MKKLTNKELVKIFGLYLFQPFIYEGSLDVIRRVGGINHGWNIIDDITGESFKVDKCKLLLRPLSSLTDEEIFTLCKILDPLTFGDYRFSKWEIEYEVEKSNEPDYSLAWVSNKKAKNIKFAIDRLFGRVTLYTGKNETEPSLMVNNTYWQWYFRNGFSVPLYPDESNPIELNIAKDISTVNKKVLT